ncbi:MAG: VanZ family protein [Phycisphaeraceae bacterium]|jgi:hypothetical protein|nr:VanZ family protein [Phycisphaeraceae bacterium]
MVPPADDNDQSLRFAPSTVRMLVVTAIVGLLTLMVMLYPMHFAARGDDAWLAIHTVGPLVLVGNIALFIPVGVCEGRLLRRMFGFVGTMTLLALIDVVLIALIGETIQLWIVERDSSLIDLVAHTIGGTIGVLCADAMFPAGCNGQSARSNEPPASNDA